MLVCRTCNALRSTAIKNWSSLFARTFPRSVRPTPRTASRLNRLGACTASTRCAPTTVTSEWIAASLMSYLPLLIPPLGVESTIGPEDEHGPDDRHDPAVPGVAGEGEGLAGRPLERPVEEPA